MLDGMNHLAMGTILSMVLHPFCPALQSRAYTFTLSLHHDGLAQTPKKWEADSLGSEGGFKNLLWLPLSRDKQQIVHSTSSGRSSHDRPCTGRGSLVTRSQVINIVGLRNDYTFCSGLQAQEIQLGSPDHFPHKRCGLGTRLHSTEHLEDAQHRLEVKGVT